jgi:hypothetical protein
VFVLFADKPQYSYVVKINRTETMTKQLYLDSTLEGNEGRLVNHSCEPNAEITQWTVNGDPRMAFQAIKYIRKGDEITVDYQTHKGRGAYPQQCLCGSTQCHGTMYTICKPNNTMRTVEPKEQMFALMNRRLDFWREFISRKSLKRIEEEVGCSLHHGL